MAWGKKTFFGWSGGVLLASCLQMSCAIAQTPEIATTINGREYAQIDQFRNLTWFQLSDACPNGICMQGAQLNGISVGGWRWATNAELNELFNHYIGDPTLSSENRDHSEFASVWGPAFFGDFRALSYLVGSSDGQQINIGDWTTIKTSDPLNTICSAANGTGCTSQILDFYDANDGLDRINTLQSQTASYREIGTGALLFRNSIPQVPEPATLLLFLSGLGFCIARSRQLMSATGADHS